MYVTSETNRSFNMSSTVSTVTNENVAHAWYRGEQAKNHTGCFHTNGVRLFSYSLCIGVTKGGKKILLDYTAKTGHFRSMTTSGKHISPTRAIADVTMSPSVISNLDGFFTP
jgi:hypothetical protein